MAQSVGHGFLTNARIEIPENCQSHSGVVYIGGDKMIPLQMTMKEICHKETLPHLPVVFIYWSGAESTTK